MPTVTLSENSLSDRQNDTKDHSNDMETLLKDHGFRTNDKTSKGCYIRKVTSHNTEVPQLIRDIFSLHHQEEVWILAKGFKDKHDSQKGKQNEADDAAHLANLGIIPTIKETPTTKNHQQLQRKRKIS